MVKKNLIDSYTIVADRVPARINIWQTDEDPVPLYEIEMPRLGPGTEALLSYLVDKLASYVPVEIENITDSKMLEEMKKRFFLKVKAAVKEKIPDYADEKIDALSGILLHRMYGLGDIEIIMADNFLEELAINGSREPISVYHKKHRWCKTTEYLKTEEEIYNFSSQIGRKVGREINSLNPIMDAHLLTGDRVAATMFPISTRGNTITIRRFARAPWTITSFLTPEYNTMSKEMAAFLWMTMQYELNVLVAGGTASGKTSVLNVLCSFVPPTQRIISIEDTRELALPKELHWNWVPMTSRQANPEGQGEVTMLDLMIASLRMRPDRMVVGEVRRREQAEAMFEAMHTGHSVYTTMHADTVEQVKRRLLEPPMEIPKAELEALQLVLVQYRDRRKGIRRTLEMAEILTGGEKDLDINYLYRWRPRTDVFEKPPDSIRVFEDLNLHTGMTVQEIKNDLKEKQQILQWMLDSKVFDIDSIGKIMQAYYTERDSLMNAFSKKISAEKFLRG